MQLENFAVIPKTAVIHIQKTAPGPPTWMATATPAMLPSPTVAERALVRARKCEISPLSSGLSNLPRITSIQCLNPRTLIHLYQNVKKTAPITRITIRKGTLMTFCFGFPFSSRMGFPSLSTSSI